MPSFAPDETDKKTLPQGVNGSARPVGGRKEYTFRKAVFVCFLRERRFKIEIISKITIFN